MKNIKVKVTVEYEIDNLVAENELKEDYNSSLKQALDDILTVESLTGLVNHESERIIKIERL